MGCLTLGPGIHSACWHGTVEVVKVLLDFKANLEVFQEKIEQNFWGESVLEVGTDLCINYKYNSEILMNKLKRIVRFMS